MKGDEFPDATVDFLGRKKTASFNAFDELIAFKTFGYFKVRAFRGLEVGKVSFVDVLCEAMLGGVGLRELLGESGWDVENDIDARLRDAKQVVFKIHVPVEKPRAFLWVADFGPLVTHVGSDIPVGHHDFAGIEPAADLRRSVVTVDGKKDRGSVRSNVERGSVFSRQIFFERSRAFGAVLRKGDRFNPDPFCLEPLNQKSGLGCLAGPVGAIDDNECPSHGHRQVYHVIPWCHSPRGLGR